MNGTSSLFPKVSNTKLTVGYGSFYQLFKSLA